jgi:hypothetical protein
MLAEKKRSSPQVRQGEEVKQDDKKLFAIKGINKDLISNKISAI